MALIGLMDGLRVNTARTEFINEFASELKLEQPTGVPTPAEVRLLFETVRSVPSGANAQTRRVRVRDYLMMRLLYFCGLRRQELLDLLVADIYWEDRVLFVRSGKGDTDRYLLVDEITLGLLRDWVAGGAPMSPLFVLTPFWSDNNFRKYCLESGLYDAYQERGLRLSVQSMRHAFATHRYERGMDFFAVMALMGHTFIDTTAAYLRTATTQVGGVYADCNPWSEKPGRSATGFVAAGNGSEEEPNSDWPEAQERLAEFASQSDAARPGGLPVLPSRQEMAQILEVSAVRPELCLLFRLLYSSGMRVDEMVRLSWEDVLWSESRLRRRNGAAVCLDGRSLQLLSEWQGSHPQPFQISAEQANFSFLEFAQQTGLAQRFAALGRPLHIDAVRYAFASHCCAKGMDRVTLMNLLGLQYLSSCEVYQRSAVLRYQASYDVSHCSEVEPG